MTGHLVQHLVRRGVEHIHAHFTQEQYMEKLQHDAGLYETAGPEMEINPREMLPIVITAVIAGLILWSIDYTIGQVMSSMAMIESPTRTAIIESKPPAYTEEPDAPLEKEPLMVAEADTDIEVSVIEHKPITAKIRTTIGHLHRIGGFRARWRGLGLSILYHFVHGIAANVFAAALGFGLIGQSLTYIFVSVCLARLHMAWTHKMITYPSSKPWYHRLPARKDCKALLLPAFVYAAAQQASIILPISVAFLIGLERPEGGHHKDNMHGMHGMGGDCHEMAVMALKFLAIPTTYLLVALAVLLPASVTLTRIEASLLPEGEETIVNFDKAEMMGDVDLSARGGCRALFVQAWRSFDRASRVRIIKLYAKMILAQVTVAFVAIHLIIAEFYVIGGERIGTFMKSAAAQLKIMAIEAHDAQGEHH